MSAVEPLGMLGLRVGGGVRRSSPEAKLRRNAAESGRDRDRDGELTPAYHANRIFMDDVEKVGKRFSRPCLGIDFGCWIPLGTDATKEFGVQLMPRYDNVRNWA